MPWRNRFQQWLADFRPIARIDCRNAKNCLRQISAPFSCRERKMILSWRYTFPQFLMSRSSILLPCRSGEKLCRDLLDLSFEKSLWKVWFDYEKDFCLRCIDINLYLWMLQGSGVAPPDHTCAIIIDPDSDTWQMWRWGQKQCRGIKKTAGGQFVCQSRHLQREKL